ncbi:tryptophan synthase subunit beta [Pontibacillus litoralis]|uniref:tryptophan synthase subunit beta n=1 Tax=Pontibacillus litoralis TaxID=516703 RepID=UPI00056C3C1B|nr:tryptophan synthase subunit beta [Pontibacillus litoralis]
MSVTFPDVNGRFGDFGGKFVPETLIVPLLEIEAALQKAMKDDGFIETFHQELKTYSGRPTPLTFASQLTHAIGGPSIYLKREDLNHTGAHKLNNAIGQALLAKRMGKTKIIAETGAGQHGVAAATVAAKLGLKCKVFMGEKDIERQQLNVFRMKLLGAEVIAVSSGSKTLKDATNEAIRHWVAHCDDEYYLIGSVVGPHPYPKMVRDFQRIIGDETMAQLGGEIPDRIYACVGGGSNAMGIFYPFLNKEVELVGVEAAGKGVHSSHHAATLTKGTPGVIHGSMTYLLQDEYGQIVEPYSISAGLDYPGVGPEHAYLHKTKGVRYEAVTDDEALQAIKTLSQTEGIIPAVESAHAIAQALKEANQLEQHQSIVINVSGRGDKDMHTIMNYFKGELGA